MDTKLKRVRKTEDYFNKIQKVEILNTLIDNLEYYRNMKNISKFTLSVECQIGKNSIYEITKKQYMPSIEVIDKIAKVLDIPITVLLIDKNDKNQAIIDLLIEHYNKTKSLKNKIIE